MVSVEPLLAMHYLLWSPYQGREGRSAFVNQVVEKGFWNETNQNTNCNPAIDIYIGIL